MLFCDFYWLVGLDDLGLLDVGIPAGGLAGLGCCVCLDLIGGVGFIAIVVVLSLLVGLYLLFRGGWLIILSVCSRKFVCWYWFSFWFWCFCLLCLGWSVYGLRLRFVGFDGCFGLVCDWFWFWLLVVVGFSCVFVGFICCWFCCLFCYWFTVLDLRICFRFVVWFVLLVWFDVRFTFCGLIC